MLDYIQDSRLKLMGPASLFPEALFSSPMLLRDIHRRVISDFEKADGKFCRPTVIVGKEGYTNRVVSTDKNDFVVEITFTPESILLVWEGETIKPLWRVRVVKDPDGKSRGLKELSIYAPQYVLGKIGSSGPFQSLCANKSTVMSAWTAPIATENQA